MTYEVATERFSGPLDKLLELIEEEKLPITEVSLAKVTDGFIKFLDAQSGTLDPNILADFLVIAARLLLIKSKVLIPDLTLSEEEEYEVKDLEARLEIYRIFAARGGSASSHIAGYWETRNASFGRPFLFIGSETVFLPGNRLTPETIREAAARVFEELTALTPETSKIKTTIITIEEKIRELMERFTRAINSNFRELTKNHSRSEVVAMFLAVLHLLKRQEISVEQGEQFGDIMLKKK
ncbi:MAG: segregation/condensation protein A [Patescibacteria group bacterium]